MFICIIFHNLYHIMYDFVKGSDWHEFEINISVITEQAFFDTSLLHMVGIPHKANSGCSAAIWKKPTVCMEWTCAFKPWGEKNNDNMRMLPEAYHAAEHACGVTVEEAIHQQIQMQNRSVIYKYLINETALNVRMGKCQRFF